MKLLIHPSRSNAARSMLSAGFSLIELMISMAIGLVLIIGASQVYLEGHKNYDSNETISRMQEAARYAMSVLENDIRMSNYWGQKAGSGAIAILVPSNTAADNCGPSFVFNASAGAFTLQPPLQGTNNSYLPAPYNGTCTPYNTAVATADTLTILRAGIGNSGGTWRLCSKAADANLTDNATCTAGYENDDFLIHSYYVDTQSQQLGVPSLRRHALIAGPTGPTMQDQEIIPGIEDMQVQFGIDPNSSGSVTMYVNPNQVPLDANGDPVAILTVRIWLLVREDTPEANFYDTTPFYEYGDRLNANGTTADLTIVADAGKAYKPFATTDTSAASVVHYRRLLVSKTIQPRNTVQ